MAPTESKIIEILIFLVLSLQETVEDGNEQTETTRVDAND